MGDQFVRSAALQRIGEVFGVSASSLSQDARFGVDLNASFNSDFRRNELDIISDDIHDVADKRSARDLASGRLVIHTVGDYCDFMERCSTTNPREVRHLLKLTGVE